MAGWRKVFLPEIHDLYPGMAPGAEALRALFPAPARPHIAWSVVPNWQDRSPWSDDPDAAREIAGYEGVKVLHGWTHSLGPSLYDWLLYGHDNRSEFAKLTEDQAAARIDRGVAVWQTVFGVRPEWFCAPRWQLSAGGVAALQAAGFRGVLGRTGLSRFGAGEVAMPTLNFDEGERGWMQALARRLRAPRIRRLLAEERPFRFVIHPGDVDHPETLAQLKDTLAAMLAAGWRAVSLDEALALSGQAR